MTRVVVEARDWIGTPYVHQASRKGAGADCLGLIRGVWRALIGPEPEMPPPYTRDWDEVGGDEVLLRAALRHLPSVEGPLAPGQVLLFRMAASAPAKHLGIVSDIAPVPRFVHAYERHGVIESPLSAPWAARIAARFVFPGQ